MLLAQDLGIPQGPAWAVGIAIILWALTGIISKILELRWNAGSKARIEEMAAQVALNKSEAEAKLASAKLAQADIDDVVSAYEEKLKEVERSCAKQITAMQAHVDIIDKKLDASEGRERNCIKELSEVKGRLTVLEELQGLKSKLIENENAINKIASKSGINLDS